MVQVLSLFLAFFYAIPGFTQDERYYRQILKGELTSKQEKINDIVFHQFNVKGSSYHIDLNEDGIEEIIQPQKRDGVDWIEIKDSSLRTLFEAKLLAMGSESVLYKIRFLRLSAKSKLLALFLDEGKTEGRRFESTARTFLLTYDNNDLSKIWFIQGPHHFHEKEAHREKYWRRDYSVEFRDINNDGIRDFIAQFNHIQRVLIYKGKGEWERY